MESWRESELERAHWSECTVSFIIGGKYIFIIRDCLFISIVLRTFVTLILVLYLDSRRRYM